MNTCLLQQTRRTLQPVGISAVAKLLQLIRSRRDHRSWFRANQAQHRARASRTFSFSPGLKRLLQPPD